VADIDYVDLRFDDRVYVKPRAPPARSRPARRRRGVLEIATLTR